MSGDGENDTDDHGDDTEYPEDREPGDGAYDQQYNPKKSLLNSFLVSQFVEGLHCGDVADIEASSHIIVHFGPAAFGVDHPAFAETVTAESWVLGYGARSPRRRSRHP